MTQNIFEARLHIVKHMSKLLLEMAEVDWETITKEEEQVMLEDYEEVAGHLLDSLDFSVNNVAENGEITATLNPIDTEKYISDLLAETQAE